MELRRSAPVIIPGADGARRIPMPPPSVKCDACQANNTDTTTERHGDFYLILCKDWRACNARWRNAG